MEITGDFDKMCFSEGGGAKPDWNSLAMLQNIKPKSYCVTQKLKCVSIYPRELETVHTKLVD